MAVHLCPTERVEQTAFIFREDMRNSERVPKNLGLDLPLSLTAGVGSYSE